MRSFKITSSVFLLLILTLVNAFTQEVKEEKKFPGKPIFNFTEVINTSVGGNKVTGIDSSTRLSAAISFSIIEDIYTLTPRVNERLDVFACEGDTANFKNRICLILMNVFSIKNVVDISVIPAFRIENRFSTVGKDCVHDGEHKAAAKLIFMPELNFEYSYGNGFEWYSNNKMYMLMLPVMDQVSNNSIIKSFDYEGDHNIGFNILSPMKVSNYSLTIFTSEYLYLMNYTENYKTKIGTGDDKITGNYTGETRFGISAGIYNTVIIGLNSLIEMTGDFTTASDKADPNIAAGVEADLTVKVGKVCFMVTYGGKKQVWVGDNVDDNGKYAPRAVNSSDNAIWGNDIGFTFKVGF